MKYDFIGTHANDFPVKLLCRQLGVQRSAYYDWRAQPGKLIAPEELALRRRMKELFAASRGSLGSRMMMKNLRQEGFEIGRDKTRRLMKSLQLKVKQKRKFKVTTDSNHKLPVATNVLNREFSPSAPNQAWGSDITYLWTQQGWIYLAVIIDLYSRRVVGWSIDRRMKKALVIRALMMAVNLRKPPPGLIHHSDRGSQNSSDATPQTSMADVPEEKEFDHQLARQTAGISSARHRWSEIVCEDAGKIAGVSPAVGCQRRRQCPRFSSRRSRGATCVCRTRGDPTRANVSGLGAPSTIREFAATQFQLPCDDGTVARRTCTTTKVAKLIVPGTGTPRGPPEPGSRSTCSEMERPAARAAKDRRWVKACPGDPIVRRIVYLPYYQLGALRRDACLRTGRAHTAGSDTTSSAGAAGERLEIVQYRWITKVKLLTKRFTMLLHLPRLDGYGKEPRVHNGPALAGHGAELRDAIASSIHTLPEQLRCSLTWDQGAEMARHDQVRLETGLKIYFCDPHTWQRGTNENTNGLLRQYFPKGTDHARYTTEELIPHLRRPLESRQYASHVSRYDQRMGRSCA